MGCLNQWLAAPANIALRRHLADFATGLLRRHFKDSTIPDMTDLPEVQAMLAERRRLPWWQQWVEEGKDRGRVEGRIEGETRLLHKQERRFGKLPEWVEAKLAVATEEQLVRWGEGVVDTRGLDELFAR